jgi:hypothetical protein
MRARAIDSATIAFGLVSIPIKVYSTELELTAVDAVASDEIALREFVPPSAVNPIFVERTSYLAPDRGAAHAYRLLRDALEEAALVGIASYSVRGKQYAVMLRPFGDGLAMHLLRDPDELKPWSVVELPRSPKPNPPTAEGRRELPVRASRESTRRAAAPARIRADGDHIGGSWAEADDVDGRRAPGRGVVPELAVGVPSPALDAAGHERTGAVAAGNDRLATRGQASDRDGDRAARRRGDSELTVAVVSPALDAAGHHRAAMKLAGRDGHTAAGEAVDLDGHGAVGR